jgi:restriction system protein
LGDAQEQSREAFSRYILEKFDPYSFQDLCAALLRSMGYYTPFVAPKGKDGGVDIIAYKDPIGASDPHIKAQVKFRSEAKASAQEIRQLKGVLGPDMGVFFSTSGFTTDAQLEARHSENHIELIDIERFIGLWIEFYSKMNEEDKARMPIVPVYFVDDKDGI